MTKEPGEQPEEPQSERGEPGSRDSGSDEPGAGVDRPAGRIDAESTISTGEPDEKQRPQGSDDVDESVVPPYEGREKEERPEGKRSPHEK